MGYDIGPRLGVDGEAEFRKAIATASETVKTLGTELKAVSSQFDKNDRSEKALTAQNEVLTRQISAQNDKLAELQKGLEASRNKYGENDAATQRWQQAVNKAQTDLNNMTRTLAENERDLENVRRGYNEAGEKLDKYGNAVEEAERKQSSFGEGAAAVGKTLANGLTVAVEAFAAAAAAAGGALVAMSVSGAAYADDILTISAQTSIATDALQGYKYAAELVDVPLETLTKSLAKNTKSMLSAQQGSKNIKAAYDKLGVSFQNTDGTLRDGQTVYWELIDALGKLPNETERDALAMQLLGKSAQELNPLIEAGSARMEELGQQAKDAGYVLSGETLNAFGAFDDQIQYLKVGAEGAKNALGTILLPALTTLATDGVELLGSFTKGIQEANGDTAKMTEVVANTLQQVVGKITEYLPQMLSAGIKIIGALGQGILDNLPQLTDAALQIITMLAQGLIEATPQLWSGVTQIVAQIATGIGEALPTLIPAAVEAITTVVQGLIDSLPLLIGAALELITGLAQGLLDAIPVLIEALPTIITSLVTALLESIPLIIQAGIDLLTALVDALPEIINTVVVAIPEIIDGILTALIENLPVIVEAGTELLTALVEDLPTIITTITDALPELISGIVDTLMDNLPTLIDTGVGLLTSLIDNLPDIITGIAKSIPLLVSGVASAITENIDKIILCGVQLLVALVSNLPEIIAGIVKAVPAIIAGIVGAFGALAEDVAKVGEDIVKGIWDGITGMVTWITDKVTGFFGGIVDGVKDFLGIHSPSRVFAEIGGNIGKGLAQGIEDTKDTVLDAAIGIGEALTRQEKQLQGKLSDMDAEALKNREAESEKKHLDAVAKKYAELEKLETKDKKKILDEIATLEREAQTKQSSDSLKKSKESIAKKYEELAELETEKKQKLLDDIAKLQEDREKELESGRTAAAKAALNDQLKALREFQNEYQKAMNDLKKNQDDMAAKLSNAGALFEKTSGGLGQMFTVRNLQGDIDQINAYGDALEKLKGRAVPQTLLNEIKGMSVEDGLEYSKRLLRMTDDQYDKYITTWQEKQDAARKVAETFYSDELNSLQEEFAAKIPEELGGLKDELNTVGQQAAQGLAIGFQSQQESVTSAIVGVLNKAVAAAKDAMQIRSPSRKWAEIGSFMAAGLGDGFTAKMRTVAKDVTGSIPGAVTIRGSYTAAATATEGIVNSLAPLLEGRGDAQPVIVPVYLNNKEIARAVYDPLKEERTRRGE